MTDQGYTMHTEYLSTSEAAARLKVKPQTMRAGYCRDGHYLGLIPVKGQNRFLYWNSDGITRLFPAPGKRQDEKDL